MAKAKLTRKHKDKFGICDRCRRTHLVSEYWFQNDNKKWTKWWCQDCLAHWMALNVSLLKSLKKIINKDQLTWFERIKIEIKTILRIKR